MQGLTYEGLLNLLQSGKAPPKFQGPPIPKPAPTSWGGHGYPGYLGPPLQKPPNPPGFIGPPIHPGWGGGGYGGGGVAGTPPPVGWGGGGYGAPHASPHPTALGLPPHASPHPLSGYVTGFQQQPPPYLWQR